MTEFIQTIKGVGLAGVVVRMFLAVLCGGIIGLERESKRRSAGFRTHTLICIGATLTTLTSQYLMGLGLTTDPARLGAQVIAGMGFIGAGAIIVTSRRQVKGLTTAAGIWTTAAVGLAIGSGLYTVGICATALMIFFQLIMHKFFSRLENTVNEFSVTVNNSPNVVSDFRAKLKQNNITVEKCKMTRNPDQTITLDITIKKARTTSMDEIMLIADNDENIISVDI